MWLKNADIIISSDQKSLIIITTVYRATGLAAPDGTLYHSPVIMNQEHVSLLKVMSMYELPTSRFSEDMSQVNVFVTNRRTDGQ